MSSKDALCFDSLDTLFHEMRNVEYGRLEDVSIDYDINDPLLTSARLDRRAPMKSFAQELITQGGHVVYLVLKVHDGIPVFAERVVRPGVIKTLRFL